MFTRPDPVEPVAVTTVSQASPTPPKIAWGRILRRVTAVVLVCIGGWAIIADSNHVVSENAVISSHLVSLRAPVAGIVSDAVGTVGATVTTGEDLATINNPRVDERAANQAVQTLERLRAELAAAQAERHTLQALLTDLTERAEQYRKAVTTRLELQAANLQRLLAAKQETLDQARRDLQRKEALQGTVSRADIERTHSTVDVLTREVEALATANASAAGVAHWAAKGVMAEPSGSNDVAYSQQRADEVRLRLASVDRTIATLSAAIAEAKARSALENGMLQRTRAAVIRAPNNGLVWRVAATTGEQVAEGDLLMQIVNCHNVFLAVAVPQSRLPNIEIGSTATFRLSGETMEHKGIVRSVTGASAMAAGTRLAATPFAGTRPSALVLIEVPRDTIALGACSVGRTAHVVLPAVGTSWLARAMDTLPGAGLLGRLAALVLPSAQARQQD